MPNLASHISSVPASGIRRVFLLASELAAAGGEDVISLVVGEPDVAVAPHIAEAAKRAWDRDDTNYTANAGIPELRTAIVELVRRDGPDLSARQLGVFLTCYLETEAQTVRGLAAKLGVSKPAITRALDRLSEFDLVRRKTDPLDRRSVLVQRTATGMAFLREMRTILRDAASTLRITAEPAQARARTGNEPARAAH